MVLKDTLRDRLERMIDSTDPDARSAAKVLLSLLAIAEANPYGSVPTNHITAVMARHLLYQGDDE
jgi:hypothetical protein